MAMRWVIAVGLFMNAVLLTGILLKMEGVVLAASGGGGVPVGNGDVNGDGEYDVTDAVYYLNWRFLGGTAPVPIECPAPAGKGLPATGQTKCYELVEGGYIEVLCDQATCKGQDGQYAAGCHSEGRFVDNGDGTVKDHCTGLMWQKDTADVNGDGKIDDADLFVWCDALAYCEELSFAGHDDWRLPNVRELQSIIDYGREGPAIDPVFGLLSGRGLGGGVGGPLVGYWSSTSITGSYAWYVHFAGGDVYGGYVSFFGTGSPYFVRAVRNDS